MNERTKKKKGTKRAHANALIQSCSKEEIREIFDMVVHHGRINDKGAPVSTAASALGKNVTFSANDIAEASIHVGTTIDIDLAHAMIEYILEYCSSGADTHHDGVGCDLVTLSDFDQLMEILSNGK